MFKSEFKKAVLFIPMWGYLLFCLFFNLILTFNVPGVDRFNSMSRALAITGQRPTVSSVEALPEEFSEVTAESGNESAPATSIRSELMAVAETEHPTFASYDVSSELTPYYTGMVSESPWAVSVLDAKYGQLQERVDRLASEGADLDVYAGSYTAFSFREFFGSFLPALTAESCVLAMLLTVHLFSYETVSRTHYFMSCTRVGRRMDICKFLTSLAVSVVAYVLLCTLSLAMYFGHWDYSGVWDSSMSSMSNLISDGSLIKPFITVTDMSVRTYLTATLVAGSALLVISVFFASIVGVMFKNIFASGVLTLLIPAVGMFLKVMFSKLKLWGLYLITSMLPGNLWMIQSRWFTEGGSDAPCLWFEVRGLTVGFIVFALLLVCAIKVAHGRDIK